MCLDACLFGVFLDRCWCLFGIFFYFVAVGLTMEGSGDLGDMTELQEAELDEDGARCMKETCLPVAGMSQNKKLSCFYIGQTQMVLDT